MIRGSGLLNIKDRHMRNRFLIFLLGIFISLAIFFIDYKIFGPDITFTLVYLIPIVGVCWYTGTGYAIFISLLCVAEWSVIKYHLYVMDRDFVIYILNIATKLFMYIFVVFLLTRLKRSLQFEKKMARIDTLTGVYNRHGFFELLELELYKMKRYDKPLSLAYIDIDDFKKINDRLGHSKGDEFLVDFTRVIRENIRESDFIARIGGDEFIILFPDMDLKNAGVAIDKIKKTVCGMMENNSLECTLSIGVGIFNSWDKSLDEMIQVVDQLMYKIKKGTKNDSLLIEIK